jgi:hypothetical protein
MEPNLSFLVPDDRVGLILDRISLRTGIDVSGGAAYICLKKLITATADTGNEHSCVIGASGQTVWCTANSPDYVYLPYLDEMEDTFVSVHTHPSKEGERVGPSTADIVNFLARSTEVDVIIGYNDVWFAYKTKYTPDPRDLSMDAISNACHKLSPLRDFYKYRKRVGGGLDSYVRMEHDSDINVIAGLYGLETERISADHVYTNDAPLYPF